MREGLDDADSVADYFAFYGEAADKLYGERIGLPGGFAVTEHVAHGVSGHIIPWNFPMALVGRTLAPALAMGNACVLKPPGTRRSPRSGSDSSRGRRASPRAS